MTRKIGSTWTKRYRVINGSRRQVWVRKINGREQVRVKKNRNTTDRTTSKVNRKRRVPNYVNFPDMGYVNYNR